MGNPDLEKLLPHIKMNVGFVFTKMELTEIRDLLLANKKEAPAKAGAIAPIDVTIPAQNTGMGPEKTSFFQALSIPTKITKGTIEIIQDVPIIKVGDKVGASEATLLNMLKIFPFHYGWLSRRSMIKDPCSAPRSSTSLMMTSRTSSWPESPMLLPYVWRLATQPWPLLHTASPMV